MEWLGVSSLILTACVVILSLTVLSLARQIGVLHERTQPMASRLQVPVIQEGDTLSDIELPLGLSSSAGVTLLFVATSCPICRLLHGEFAKLMRTQTDEQAFWVFPMDRQQAINEYAHTHGLPKTNVFVSSVLASQCAVTKTPTLVRLQRSDDDWRIVLRRPIDRVQQLAGLMVNPLPQQGDTISPTMMGARA